VVKYLGKKRVKVKSLEHSPLFVPNLGHFSHFVHNFEQCPLIVPKLEHHPFSSRIWNIALYLRTIHRINLEKTFVKYFLYFQVSEAGVHRPHVSGIHGKASEGAFSIVLAGGYEDDEVCWLWMK